MQPPVANHVRKEQERQKETFDAKVQERYFANNNPVFVHNYNSSGTEWSVLGDRSFKVAMADGRTLRKHLDQIRQ